MKYLFLSGLYPKEAENILKEKTKAHLLQVAPNNLQWAIADGLGQNNVDFEVLSLPFLPSYPMGYKDLYTPASTIIDKNEKKIGKMLPYNSLMIYKDYSIQHQVKKNVIEWIVNNDIAKSDKFAVLVYTEYSPFLLPLISLKRQYPNMVIGAIITDLIDDNKNFKSNRSFFKKIQMRREERIVKNVIYPNIDKFILLTEAMVEKIPVAKDRFIVVEGIYNKPFDGKNKYSKRSGVLFYSGTLEEYSGIRELVDAFTRINNNEICLEICGSGSEAEYVVDLSVKDKRIKYLGVLPRDKVIELQQSASVLINPRRPDCSITKYSFPSKTIEYLSSGTPMIGYKLEGIPVEYYDYMYCVKDANSDVLTDTIYNVLTKSPEELNEKGARALQFILNQKNPKSQVHKIISFLEH